MSELLITCPVDNSSAVLDRLLRYGIAMIDEVRAGDQLVHLANSIGSVVPHRDSRPDGVTIIEDRGDRSPGMSGFTRAALPPHTDRSGVPVPPGLILTTCSREPSSGGDALLVDGRAVYDDLACTDPEALEALCTPRSAMFGGADGFLGSVFDRKADGLVAVRFRQDGLVRFSPSAAPHVTTLRAAIDRHTLVVPVRRSTGYVVDNTRWLHGRTVFRGSRVVLRVTADISTTWPLAGFRPTHMAPSADAVSP